MNEYTETFKVHVFQTDTDGRLSVKSLFDFLNEAAGNHCIEEKITVADLQQIGLTWMLSRMHIEIAGLPVYGESVTVKTWPTGARGLYSCRDFLVLSESGIELVKATSAWLTINLEKRRVVRLPEKILEIHPDTEGVNRILIDNFKDKLAEPDSEAEINHEYTAAVSTLDINRHVTAPVYLQWMLDALPPSIPESMSLKTLEINYKQEILPGGSAVAKHSIDESDGMMAIRHSISDAESGITNCLAATAWEKKPSRT